MVSMYAGVGRVQLREDAADRGQEIWREQFIPMLRQQRGFRGVFLLRDRAGNRGMNVTLWDSEEDMRAGIAALTLHGALQDLQQRVLASPIERETYEVVISEQV